MIRSISSLIALVAVTGVVTGATGLAYLREQSGTLPSLDPILDYRPERHSTVVDRTGRDLFIIGEERRSPVTYGDLPLHLIQAFVAAEDQNFFGHGGVDPKAILRAAASNLQGDGVTSGASTITQQLVKNLVLSSEQSLERKAREALLAIDLERHLSKEEILGRYLNEIYLGRGAYGVASAAEVYFGKEVHDLTLAEAAILAGLPKAPSKYGATPEAARVRMLYVLDRMLDEGYITPAESEAAARMAVDLLTAPGASTAPGRWRSHYAQAALAELHLAGRDEGLSTDGRVVSLALDPIVQSALERSLRDGLMRHDRKHEPWRGPVTDPQASAPVASWVKAQVIELGESGIVQDQEGRSYTLDQASMDWAGRSLRPGMAVWVEIDGSAAGLRQLPKVQGAAVAMDPRTGEVLAMTGAFSETVDHFDRATRAMRQPGSALKPFIYAMALETGWSPTSPILDVEVAFEGGAPDEVWRPGDHGFSEKGYVTLRSGLEYSRNTVTLRLFQSLGMDEVLETMRGLGLYEKPLRNASLALGSQEINLLDLTSAYTVFAGDGSLRAPTFLLSDTPPAPVAPPPFDAITRAQIRSMLAGVTEYGTAWRAFKDAGYTVHGKTGTANDAKDAWFIGFTGGLLVGVHVGHDEPRPLGTGEGGGSTAAPIVRAIFDALPDAYRRSDYVLPQGIEIIEIDPDTGLPQEGGFLELVRRANP
jgi:penicillin-binding protein 1A